MDVCVYIYIYTHTHTLTYIHIYASICYTHNTYTHASRESRFASKVHDTYTDTNADTSTDTTPYVSPTARTHGAGCCKQRGKSSHTKVGRRAKGIIAMSCTAHVCACVQACVKVFINLGNASLPGLLHGAARVGLADEVAALIASNADVNAKDWVCTKSLVLLALVSSTSLSLSLSRSLFLSLSALSLYMYIYMYTYVYRRAKRACLWLWSTSTTQQRRCWCSPLLPPAWTLIGRTWTAVQC